MDVVGVLGTAALLVGYGAGLRRVRQRGLAWRARRTVSWVVGVVLFAGSTLGLDHPGHRLVWVFTLQVVSVLIVVPVFLAYGRPIALATDALVLERPLLQGRAMRLLTSPLLGPLVVPVVLSLVFFTPVMPAALEHAALGQLLQVVLLGIGVLIALGLIGDGSEHEGSLALGAAVAIGFGEFLVDAVPGIVLRLQTHVMGASYWRAHSARPLTEQQHAGAVLWFVAEFADLPFLVILIRRWIRADERDAVRVDLELDDTYDDRPWWETDKARLGSHRLGRD